MHTTLVILAAGLGSRFGGGSAKQVTVLGKHGEIMADYSVYDAIKGGFTKIVYVIKPEMEQAFIENVSSKIKGAEVALAFQSIDDLPPGFSPQGREKPWGTAHAVWAARNVVNEPFMMIHADDFYGADIYAGINKFLRDKNNGDFDYAMGGYYLQKTLSSHGGVSRGVCSVANGYVTDVRETHKIERRHDGIAYPDGDDWKYLPGSTIVSMGAFAFKPTIFDAIDKKLIEFLQTNPQNSKAELLMPDVVSSLITSKTATVKVIESKSQWLGVTYKEDTEIVQKAIADLTADGQYPEKLF